MRGIDFSRWFLHVLVWDGILPTCVFLVSFAVRIALPNNPRIVEFTAMVVPISAFWVRFLIGKRQIASNYCGNIFRTAQFVVFCLAIMLLALIDCVFILMPIGKLSAVKEDRVIWMILLCLYFSAMTFTWYPGRNEGQLT